MKIAVTEACPKIKIGGIPKSSSMEHLMKNLEEKKDNGVFQSFDLEKFFDKEILIDTIDTIKREAKISDKDYRLWYTINEDANIGVKTSVWNSKTKLVRNSIGQSIFGAALASSLNIGCVVEKTFGGKA